MKLMLFCLNIFLLFASCTTKQKADLVIKNATIYQVNDSFGVANVMVIKEGKIIAIGGDTLLNQYNAANLLDAEQKFIYPGFIDAHCHFTGYALDSYKLKLFGTKSFDEVIKKLSTYSKPINSKWIEGTGWDQNDWVNKQFPTKDSLDKIFPETPVFLLRVDGHAALLNQKALDICGIDKNTKIEGGEIEIKNTRLTGIVIDNAINLVRSHLPIRTKEASIHDIVDAQHEFFKVGLTSIVECGVKKEIIEWLKEAYDKKELCLRTTCMLNADQNYLMTYLNTTPYKSDYLHVAGFKVYADGSLGSRGAFLLNEYTDRHLHNGAMLLSIDSLKNIANQVEHSSYQLCVHAIGDAANRATLKIFGDVLKKKNNKRWRIEHAQVVDSNDVHFFHDFSIIPSVQPTHATSDMYWAEARLGKGRMKEAYAYKTLLKQNGWLPLGTDFPVEKLNPLYTFYAAVFRKDKENFPANGFQIENALSREDALRGITIWSAKSVFEESQKGSLEKGKFADFVILDTDLMKANPQKMYNAKVLSTYVMGKKVFDQK